MPRFLVQKKKKYLICGFLQDWTLQVKFVQLRDAGVYECQVSTHPPTSIFLHLHVVGEYMGRLMVNCMFRKGLGLWLIFAFNYFHRQINSIGGVSFQIDF